MAEIPAVLQGPRVRAVLLAVTVLAVPGLAATLDSPKQSTASAPPEAASGVQTAKPAAPGFAGGVLPAPAAPAGLVFHDRVSPGELVHGTSRAKQ